MKVAFVYDRVNKIGGAERVLESLHEIFPDAPLYTAVYNSQTAPWAKTFKVIPSFMQKIPFAKTHHELFPWLTPLAFESFDFSEFDIVISITSAEAKGIITKPQTMHVCYCLTPTRYLWSHTVDYSLPLILKLLISNLRIWDQVAANRPDSYLAISENVACRIRKYYKCSAMVIYPGTDLKKWQIINARPPASSLAGEVGRGKWINGKYFLIVSRLVPYKKIDLAVKVFNKLRLPLVIIGSGSEEAKLKELAKSNIKFLGQLTDEEILSYYQNCKALIFPGEEDYGLTVLEAQACGRPVIAYQAGGALETIKKGRTGEFFFPQNAEALENIIKNFNEKKYSKPDCRKQAERFSETLFKKRFKNAIIKLWHEYQRKH